MCCAGKHAFVLEVHDGKSVTAEGFSCDLSKLEDLMLLMHMAPEMEKLSFCVSIIAFCYMITWKTALSIQSSAWKLIR